MKKKLKLAKKTIKNLKLKLKLANDQKVAPASLVLDRSNTGSC